MVSEYYLQEWFTGVTHDRGARGVTQTNQFVPAG